MQDQHTITFLKMAAIELRNIAEEAPELANRLLQIAQQIQMEADALERRRPDALAAD